MPDDTQDTQSPKRRRFFGRSSEPEAAPVAEDEFDDELEMEAELDYFVKQKPKLTAEQRHYLKLRSEHKARKPNFRRQEWFRYARLGDTYRKPKGLHSKMRKGKRYRPPRVKVGYGGPKAVRGLHPSGFEEVMVYNVKDLRRIDPRVQAARIGHGVGTKKRIEIEEEADNRNIRVLNRGY